MNNQLNTHPYLLIDDIANLLVDVPDDSIISRAIHKDEHINVVLFAFATGQTLSEHTAASSAIIQILSGEAVIGLGEDSYEAHAGTWIHMQARLPHSVVEEVTRLKQQPGGDILVAGSSTLVHTLMEHDLVDEYRLLVYPLVVGEGKRLFLDGSKTSLRLVGSRAFSTGVILLTYVPAVPSDNE